MSGDVKVVGQSASSKAISGWESGVSAEVEI